MTDFVVCGLPRAGTTIISRFIGGIPGVHVLHEPLQCLAKRGCLPRLPESEETWGLTGMKEPFHILPQITVFPNVTTLRFLRDALGTRFVWVTRDCMATYESFKRWSVSYRDFQYAWESFEEFRCGQPVIQYEDFCADPVGTWNKLMPLGQSVTTDKVRLAPVSEPFIGDWKAKDSTEIIK
jgi:hypothetical protein